MSGDLWLSGESTWRRLNSGHLDHDAAQLPVDLCASGISSFDVLGQTHAHLIVNHRARKQLPGTVHVVSVCCTGE